ncbi:hypothetical protein FHR92_003976 [Fontibacillus solani]|uniref:Uncharacterized protein n=1 Tax=Fontibacillus solani TaxID=1572857 RepID=A0A7W3SWE6_9BACL|nr:hypothetical protein [Fontibacillus solani]MBA9087491.1 hypothetical protein [Fontibacillus solani]
MTKNQVNTDEKYEQINEFTSLVKPLQEYMMKNYGFHSKVIIEPTGATVVTNEMFVPLELGGDK